MGATLKIKVKRRFKPSKLKLLKNNRVKENPQWGSFRTKIFGAIGFILRSMFAGKIIQQNAPGDYVEPEKKPLTDFRAR